jgi:hypothetical protein
MDILIGHQQHGLELLQMMINNSQQIVQMLAKARHEASEILKNM